MSKGLQIALATASVFAFVAWVISSGEGTYLYFQSVDAFVAGIEGASDVQNRDLRVHGFVVEGSIDSNLVEGRVSFAVSDSKLSESSPEQPAASARPHQLDVVYNGIDLPDLFRDGAEVVIEGRMQDGAFLAKRVMAKCPSKYENSPEQPAQVAEATTAR